MGSGELCMLAGLGESFTLRGALGKPLGGGGRWRVWRMCARSAPATHRSNSSRRIWLPMCASSAEQPPHPNHSHTLSAKSFDPPLHPLPVKEQNRGMGCACKGGRRSVLGPGAPSSVGSGSAGEALIRNKPAGGWMSIRRSSPEINEKQMCTLNNKGSAPLLPPLPLLSRNARGWLARSTMRASVKTAGDPGRGSICWQ